MKLIKPNPAGWKVVRCHEVFTTSLVESSRLARLGRLAALAVGNLRCVLPSRKV
jgi:hypothetical protein